MTTYYPEILPKNGYPVGTLCEYCQNAIPDKRGHGCSWSRAFQPVKDWIATTVVRGYKDRNIQSFCVHECPEFLEEPYRPEYPEEEWL